MEILKKCKVNFFVLQTDWISFTWHAAVSQKSNIYFYKIFVLPAPLLSMGKRAENGTCTVVVAEVPVLRS